jgi:thioredoxin-like negative regulator of GroEL
MSFDESKDYNKKYLKYKEKYLILKKKEEKKYKKNMIMAGGANSDDKKTLALFKAEWCGHCTAFKGTWNKLKTEMNDKVSFVTYDADKNKNEIENYQIQGFPTLILLTGNKAVEYIGPRDAISIKDFIDQH